MKSKTIRGVFGVLCGGVLLYFVSISCNSVEPEEYGYGDDYIIYAKVLGETVKEKDILIVLRDSTQQDYSIHNNFEKYLEHFPEASRETLENYVTANQSKTKLKRIPEIECVFQSDYDEALGKNKVSVSLSNVGYNAYKTEAFVSVGALYAPLVGSSSLIFLVKINNQWQIKKSVMTWIS